MATAHSARSGDGAPPTQKVRAKPKGFPGPDDAGVPSGWRPKATKREVRIDEPGAVIQDLLVRGGDIVVNAPDVTIRRVKLQGGRITNFRGTGCQRRLTIEDTTIEPASGKSASPDSEGVIEVADYTARRVKIWARAEGFRIGGLGEPGCGPTRIEDSFLKIVIPRGRCDLHADGVQGYGAPDATIVNTTIDFRQAACGTAPVFFPADQGNSRLDVDRLLVMGGGYPFRTGVPGNIRGLRVVDQSWGYGPVEADCSALTQWDAATVKIDSRYRVVDRVRNIPCR